MRVYERREAAIANHILHPPQALYDLGVGLKSEWRTLRKIYRRLQLFGCEPHPQTYQTLRDNSFPGVLMNVAVGESDGRATLFDVADDPMQASLLPVPNATAETPVEVWSLDRFDREMGHQDRVLLWLDIEGSELPALRGGRELLDSGRVRWINLEERRRGHHPAKGWTDSTEMHLFLSKVGYVRVATYNRHRTHQDVIYVHPEEPVKTTSKRSCEFIFQRALELVVKRHGQTIVELGSIRNAAAAHTDGHSTVAWGASGLTTWSVDIDVRSTRLTQQVLGDRFPNMRCLTCDGVWFLKTFPHTIDLLYLDGPDPDKEDGRRWAAEALTEALPRLAPHAVILIDDTDLPRRGKGEFAIPLAESVGFTLVHIGRQALLARGAQ
jgi:FkbM family methyltransferase